jgi:DNA polymerase III subunit epsilon
MNEPLAIVDVETTGTSAVYGRVIEVAVIRVQGRRVVETFTSLVNPECYIHPMIEGLTGITNEMVATAPTFAEISRQLRLLLQGAIFVAHNARFDYGFLRQEFARRRVNFSARCLCTMRLSRRLFPGQGRHDLSTIIDRHGIVCEARHRAMGDAQAVLEFLRVVWERTAEEEYEQALLKVMKEARLPPAIQRDDVRNLPEEPGVYLFYGKEGELLYVGKSKNIRSRVSGHFSNDHRSAKEMEMCRNLHHVETRRTAGELGALLLESRLIKELRPIYNSASRSTRKMIVARRRANAEGYLAVSVEEIERIADGEQESILAVFKSTRQAQEALRRMAKEHRLCLALLGLERNRGYCFGYHLHQCNGACGGDEDPAQYNLRLTDAFAKRLVKTWPYRGSVLIEEKHPHNGDGEAFLVSNWCLMSSVRYSDVGIDKHVADGNRFDYDTYKILLRYMSDPSNRKNMRVLSDAEVRRLIAEAQEAAS